MAEKRQKLFDQFPPVTPEEWRAKAEVDLKGADFDKKMVWRTNEGFNAQPLYRSVDIKDFKTIDSLPGEFPFVRGTRTNNVWLVRQDIDAHDLKEANARSRRDSVFKVSGSMSTALGCQKAPTTFLTPPRSTAVFPPTAASTMASIVVGTL